MRNAITKYLHSPEKRTTTQISFPMFAQDRICDQAMYVMFSFAILCVDGIHNESDNKTCLFFPVFLTNTLCYSTAPLLSIR